MKPILRLACIATFLIGARTRSATRVISSCPLDKHKIGHEMSVRFQKYLLSLPGAGALATRWMAGTGGGGVPAALIVGVWDTVGAIVSVADTGNPDMTQLSLRIHEPAVCRAVIAAGQIFHA